MDRIPFAIVGPAFFVIEAGLCEHLVNAGLSVLVTVLSMDTLAMSERELLLQRWNGDALFGFAL
jgi:hypothetical protein